MDRRGFLRGIIAAGAAPVIVRADSLMRIVPRAATVITPVSIINAALDVLTPDLDIWNQEFTLSIAEYERHATQSGLIAIRRPAWYTKPLTHA